MKKYLKEEFSGWKPWEVFWLTAAALVIIGLSIYWGDSPMGMISSTTGVICVVCTGKGKLSAYLFGLINSVLYAIIAFEAAYSALSEEPRPAVSDGAEEVSDACVSIDLAVTDGAVTVTIENTGTVLSDDEIKRLTEPFFTSKSTGLGLGVPIAIGLAEASGGHIDFTRRESGGLRVCVTLPRAPKEDDGDEPKDETA